MATARKKKAAPKPTENVTEANYTLDQPYILLANNATVTLEIIISGQGLSSTTNIRLDRQELNTDGQGSIPETTLGNSNDLDKKVLFIATVITNTLGQVNQATALIKLRGGIAPGDFKLSAPVKQGNNVIFTSIIEFITINA